MSCKHDINYKVKVFIWYFYALRNQPFNLLGISNKTEVFCTFLETMETKIGLNDFMSRLSNVYKLL